MDQPRFGLPIREPLHNHKTGEPYTFESADSAERYRGQIENIAAICNQPLVYEWIFAQQLRGEPYPLERARQFLVWGDRGWAEQTHFLFFITYKNEVVGACDLKTPDPVAEIGYWMSALHPGVMTNAVKKLCEIAKRAGYKKLFAKVKPGNHRSMGVLQRAGFGSWEDIVSEGQPYRRCTLDLT